MNLLIDSAYKSSFLRYCIAYCKVLGASGIVGGLAWLALPGFFCFGKFAALSDPVEPCLLKFVPRVVTFACLLRELADLELQRSRELRSMREVPALAPVFFTVLNPFTF